MVYITGVIKITQRYKYTTLFHNASQGMCWLAHAFKVFYFHNHWNWFLYLMGRYW